MERKLMVRIRGSVYMIPQEDILYLENDLRKIHLYLTEGEMQFYGTFRQILPELDERFQCCDRSYIINLSHIRALRQNGSYEIYMDNGRHIVLGKSGFLRVKAGLEAYLKR